MELRIKITKKNVKQIAKILPLLLEENIEEERISEVDIDYSTFEKHYNNYRYLSIPKEMKGLNPGEIIITDETKAVGSWGQFNSYFPIKAVLRVIANLMIKNQSVTVDLNDIVILCRKEFKKANLTKYRGFPISEKPSSTGRLVWHFITTAHMMGLVVIDGGNRKSIPLNDWVGVAISISKEGFEFAVLPNRILDMREDVQILTIEEKNWLLDYLKKIDKMGYKEYTFLSRVYGVLKKREDVKSWLEEDIEFGDYVKGWSRKSNIEVELRKQISNLAIVFSSSKIAILRELGVISNKRGDYTVISDIYSGESVR